MKNINFYKELKVVLEGENNTHDAGGLTREWMNLAIKELVKEVGLLRICNTKQTAYRFNENFRRSE